MPFDGFGVVANARNSWPDTADFQDLGATWVRTIVYDFDSLDHALDTLPAGVQVIALLNAETSGIRDDLSGWEGTIAEFARRFGGRVAVVECLNEWDMGIGDDDALRMAATNAVLCARAAAPTLKAAGIDCVLGSVAGGAWPRALELAREQLTPDDRALLAGACFHPYGKGANGVPADWQDLSIAINSAYEAINADADAPLRIWLTEYGIKIVDAGDEDQQAEYVRQSYAVLSQLPTERLGAACYFAWHDAVGGPDEQGELAFGLRGPRGPRAAWTAFRECTQQNAPADPGVPAEPAVLAEPAAAIS